MRVVRHITVVLVAILIGMSVYPGLIGSTIFSLLGIISLFPLLSQWFLVVAVFAIQDLMQRRPFRSAFGIQAAMISFIAFGLVLWRVPMWVGLAVSRPAFEQFVQTATIPSDAMVRSDSLSRWLGVYYFDSWGVDARGGTYFRTGKGANMMDEISYGFALHPNPIGSPFGSSDYWLYRLAGDWHTFSVSDDSY